MTASLNRIEGKQINGFSHIITSITHGAINVENQHYPTKPQLEQIAHFKL